jgi:predicted transcriptional regulator
MPNNALYKGDYYQIRIDKELKDALVKRLDEIARSLERLFKGFTANQTIVDYMPIYAGIVKLIRAAKTTVDTIRSIQTVREIARKRGGITWLDF